MCVHLCLGAWMHVIMGVGIELFPVIMYPVWINFQDPFVNIAPKKPNWDLLRDVQKKLDKLERRTQKAIYKLMGEYPFLNNVLSLVEHFF